ncbi:MAG: hypothetical protein HOO06_15620 [Bdellovibrionaceae bacterium]|jgi:hypothetical protein|nr:hypothetical protein [Pseudobdellovibrionaceae bacterium]
MRLLVILIAIFITQGLKAQTSDFFSGKAVQNVCQNVIKENRPGVYISQYPQFVQGTESLFYMQRSQGKYVVNMILLSQPDEAIELFSFKNKIHDILLHGHSLWVLTNETLQEWDLHSGKFVTLSNTHFNKRSPSNRNYAHAMAAHKNLIYIAHGGQGLHTFDIQQKTLLKTYDLGLANQPGGHYSKAIAISIEGNSAIIGVDNITAPQEDTKPFNGLIKFNLSDPNLHVKNSYNRKTAGVLAYAYLKINGGTVHINNLGLYHSISVNELNKGMPIKPKTHPIYETVDGMRQLVELSGDILIEDQRIYACGTIYKNNDKGTSKQLGKVVVY